MAAASDHIWQEAQSWERGQDARKLLQADIGG
jgi:hypothetical protein